MTKLQRAIAVGYGGLVGLSGAVMLALVVVLMLSGCDTNKELLAPGGGEREPSGIAMRKYQTIYTACGTFYLDYPRDFLGPIPPGHGRIGATSSDLCARSIGDPTDGQDFRRGDPTDTQDSRLSPGVMGDPDGPDNGDSDGTVVKARSIGDPDGPERGDPTNDD